MTDPLDDSRVTLSVEVGNRLRERRQELSRSLREVADRAAVSPGHLSDIENGKSHASLPVLLRLGRVLQYPLAELLPRIGGHRVTEGRVELTGPRMTSLSRSDLDLRVDDLRLIAGQHLTETLDRGTDALIYVITGECVLEVGQNTYVLRDRDSADIERAATVKIGATTNTLALIARGRRQ